MNVFARAVITGFGMSLGSALYKKFSKRLGLDEESSDQKPEDVVDGDSDEEDAGTDDEIEDDAPSRH